MINFTFRLLSMNIDASSVTLFFSLTDKLYKSLNLKACGVWAKKELLRFKLKSWFLTLYFIESLDFIEGVPAIGFSLLDFSWDANFHPLKRFIKKITTMALKNGMPKGVVLNVNFPKLKEKEIKGVKICRQAKAYWVEDFDKRINPIGKEYYWLTGTFVNEDNEEDTDEWALKNGYVSVVPTQFDLTAHQSIRYFNKWNL